MKSIVQHAGFMLAAGLLSLSQISVADSGGDNWSISGWINEAMIYYDDGQGSDIVQASDNGTTLGSRITLAGSTDLENAGLTAGFEVILEPIADNSILILSNQDDFGDNNGHSIGVLGSSIHVGGALGKVTVGLQSMPTDNIAVLADPSLTLWSGISPVFRANGFFVQGTGDTVDDGTPNERTVSRAVWGDFLNCLGTPALRGTGGIGIDCNGIYRKGIRYDLPSFGPLSIAIGYANDDVYDIAAKYNGELAGMKTILHVGYSMNPGAAVASDSDYSYEDPDTFQLQAGLMDTNTGLFGTIAYQHESADIVGTPNAGNAIADTTDAYYLKVGVKRAFTSLGDTALYFDYGSYNDQFGFVQAAEGVTGSELQRFGFSVDQYFGSRLIVYGKYENFDAEVDGGPLAQTLYGNGDELHTFTAGMTFFF